MRSKQWLIRPCLWLLLMLFVTACSGESDRYRFTIAVAGGPTGWPVWVNDLIIDEMDVPAGYQGGGFDHNPPGGSQVGLPHPVTAPDSVQASWFSYRNRTFYKINLELPDDMDKKLKVWYETYPPPKYSHHFILGFSGRGEALVWWEAFCLECGYDRSQDFSTAIIENAKATIIEGDVKRYEKRIQYAIDRGVIPSPE